jgi:hypothetical protein
VTKNGMQKYILLYYIQLIEILFYFRYQMRNT